MHCGSRHALVQAPKKSSLQLLQSVKRLSEVVMSARGSQAELDDLIKDLENEDRPGGPSVRPLIDLIVMVC